MNINTIKGINDKTEKLLAKLKIFSINDLLEYYPFRYDFLIVTSLEKTIQNAGMINVQIIGNITIKYFDKRKNYLKFRALCTGKIINVLIFNRAFLKSKLQVGQYISLIGKYDSKNNNFLATDLKLKMITSNVIEPVYHLVNGLTSSQINSYVNFALKYSNCIVDYIPNYLNVKYEFINKLDAVRYIHNPQTPFLVKKAKLKLIYEEFFIFMFKMNYLKNQRQKESREVLRNIDKSILDDIICRLPFSLTYDQLAAVNDIYNDFISNKRMNRLILGDVGSGKTIISIIAMLLNCSEGYQSALMAPTEVLALQHYENIKKLFPDLKIECLVGSVTKTKRKKILKNLISGYTEILIGTHALLSDDVAFANLGLVVTDEQHRFGVNQRKIMQNKGKLVDIIYMSATPIPRTYALALYGDMDLSMIKTKPNGRKEIITKVVKEDNIKTVLDMCWQELKKGHQIYVVAPLIQDDESSINDIYKLEKKFNLAFNHKVNIGILHGKMKKDDKNKIMSEFKSNECQILISTTVIEVGVDVANSTMMIIYNAERFGLATLHQLRGRVGRNNMQSYCYLIANEEIPRLQVLETSNDGFYISQKDFELRGEGDLFGIKQSGDMQFKIGDIKRDQKILLQCQKDSYEYLENFDNNELYLRIIDSMKCNN